MGLFCGDMGLFCGHIGLFCEVGTRGSLCVHLFIRRAGSTWLY